MKRTNEKDTSPTLKKSKTEHEPLNSQKLVLPPKTVIPEKGELKKDPLFSKLIKPKTAPELIVLSSDDEDDIMMHKKMLAESLETTSNSPSNTVSVKGKEKQVQQSPPKISQANAVTERVSITPIPETVASAMDISNLDGEDDEEEYGAEEAMEEEEEEEEVHDAFVDANNNLSNLYSDNMSEVDELRSDTELEEADEEDDDDEIDIISVANSPKEDGDVSTNTEIIKYSNEEIKSNGNNLELSNDNMESSDEMIITADDKVSESMTTVATVVPTFESSTTHTNRPVRGLTNQVKTYNDIDNSINLSILSDSDDPDAMPTIITAKKPSRMKPSPSRTELPAVILSRFTKELTSRRRLKTGFVYDTAMSYHATPNPMEIHPEDPRRIFKIFHILEQHGLLQECERINSRRATKEEVLLVHNILHYRKLRETAGMFFYFLYIIFLYKLLSIYLDLQSRSDYMAMENDFDSIYLNSNSFESALYAVGSLINLMEAVINNKVKNAFAIIRPPGHHAETDMPMGFCLFNNVAIATRDCIKRLGVKKVLIVDW